MEEETRSGATWRGVVLPILMTALAAGLALIPLALSGQKPGGEIEAPMAVVILFGLLSSTASGLSTTSIGGSKHEEQEERIY